jgi:ribonuclease BN (tRNA processing enzyme)
MRITTAGVGGAWAPAGTWNTINIVHAPDNVNLMVDCGGDARHALAGSGISTDSVGGIWISHHHGDHCDGLEYFAFERYCLKKPKPTLFIHEKMIEQLWQSFKAKLEPFQDFQNNKLSDYFDIALIRDHVTTMWRGFQLTPVTMPHINPLNQQLIGNSVGVEVIDQDGVSVFFTTDTRTIDLDDPAFGLAASFYRSSDLILQDCATKKSVVHACFDELKSYPDHIKAKMVLTHCSDRLLPVDTQNAGFHSQARAGGSIEVVKRDAVSNNA